MVTGYAASGLPDGLSLDPVTGIISGTATIPGSYPVSITVSNDVGNTTATLTLSVIQATGFNDWASGYNFNGALADTPYNDGVPNLLKYVYDIDPTHPMTTGEIAALPKADFATVSGVKYLTINYRQYTALTGVTVHVQTSTDLVNWTTVAPDLSHQIGTDATTGDPIEQVGVLATGGKQFLRLDVTLP